MKRFYGLLAPLLFAAACADGDDEYLAPDAGTDPQLDGSSDASQPPPVGERDAAPDAIVDAGSDAPVDESVRWVRETVALDGATLQAVWGSSPTDVWAVGSGGTIVHYDGSAWVAVESNTDETFRAVWGSSASEVWLGGSTTLLRRTSGWQSGGTTFEELPTWDGPPVAVHGISGTGPNDVWAVGDYALAVVDGTLRTIGAWHWDGTDWTPERVVNDFSRPGGDDKEALRSVWAASASDVWLGGCFGRAFRNPVYDPLTPPSTAFVTGMAALPPWTETDSASRADLVGTWGSSATNVWTVGRNGVIRSWDGTSAFLWRSHDAKVSVDLNAVWGSGSDVWAVGDNSTIVHWDGVSWRTERTDPGLRLRGIWGSGNDIWIVGENALLRREKESQP